MPIVKKIKIPSCFLYTGLIMDPAIVGLRKPKCGWFKEVRNQQNQRARQPDMQRTRSDPLITIHTHASHTEHGGSIGGAGASPNGNSAANIETRANYPFRRRRRRFQLRSSPCFHSAYNNPRHRSSPLEHSSIQRCQRLSIQKSPLRVLRLASRVSQRRPRCRFHSSSLQKHRLGTSFLHAV